jgi:hypothetical protein
MGNTVFVVKNQQGLYLTKQQEWVDGADNHGLYRTRHRDEAINTVFEVSSRDIYLRAETVICDLDAKGNPALATAETVTPARAAQIARQQNADLEDEPAPAEEVAPDESEAAPETETRSEASGDAQPETPAETDLDAPAALETPADIEPAARAGEDPPPEA